MPERAAKPYAAFDMVVIAGSAGGITALIPILRDLPQNFPVPIIVVQHLPSAAHYISRLDRVLQSRTELQVKWAEDGERPLAGTVYLAPQDRDTSLNLKTRCLSVLGGPGLFKPSADLLFCAAAEIFGSRTMAVVLSGVLSDGARGSAAIACAGGRVLAQTAAEAEFNDMPMAAMERSHVSLSFDSTSLACVISNLVMVRGAAAWFQIGKAVVAT